MNYMKNCCCCKVPGEVRGKLMLEKVPGELQGKRKKDSVFEQIQAGHRVDIIDHWSIIEHFA